LTRQPSAAERVLLTEDAIWINHKKSNTVTRSTWKGESVWSWGWLRKRKGFDYGTMVEAGRHDVAHRGQDWNMKGRRKEEGGGNSWGKDFDYGVMVEADRKEVAHRLKDWRGASGWSCGWFSGGKGSDYGD
jgi:hypothetical protein